MAWKAATTAIRIGLVVLVLANVLLVTSYATTYWAESSNGMRFGIWHQCYKNRCDMMFITDGWWRGFQAMLSMGLIFGCAALILCILYIFLPSWDEYKFFGIIIGVLSIITFLVMLLGVCIFGGMLPQRYGGKHYANYEETVSYSFYLGIVSMLIFLIGAVFGMIDTCTE